MREFDFNATEEQLGLSEEQIETLREEAQREEYREISERKNTMRKLAEFLDSIEVFFDRADDVLTLAEALVAKGYDTLGKVGGTEQEK